MAHPRPLLAWVFAATACGSLTPLVDGDGLPGAVRTDGTDPTTPNKPDEPTTPDDPLFCVDQESARAAPFSLAGSTVDAGDDIAPACGVSGAQDYVVAWTAPSRGDYVIDLAGSSFDTTLVVSEACTGEAIACNDDWLPAKVSQVVVSLTAGQTVLLGVDGGKRAAAGDFSLNVDLLEAAELDCGDGRDVDADGLVDCDDDDCQASLDCALPCANGVLAPPFPIIVQGSTVGAGNESTPRCSASSTAPDLALQFTAPTTRTYTATTNGSSFDTVLYALDGCGGEQFGCDDDGGNGRQSLLSMPMVAGQTVLLVVDGYQNQSGTVQLRID